MWSLYLANNRQRALRILVVHPSVRPSDRCSSVCLKWCVYIYCAPISREWIPLQYGGFQYNFTQIFIMWVRIAGKTFKVTRSKVKVPQRRPRKSCELDRYWTADEIWTKRWTNIVGRLTEWLDFQGHCMSQTSKLLCVQVCESCNVGGIHCDGAASKITF